MKQGLASLVIACLLLSAQASSIVESLKIKAQGLKTAGQSGGYLQGAKTGVQLHESISGAWNGMKIRRTASYIIFRLNSELREVVIEKEGAPNLGYDDFLNELPPDDCRYAAVAIDYSLPSGDRSKLVFVLWCPENARVRHKMVYAGTKDTMKKALEGINLEIQGTDLSEITFEAVVAKSKSVRCSNSDFTIT